MNIHRLTAAAALLLVASAPAWAINKCTGPNGKTVFQDMPCVGQGTEVTVNPASGSSADPVAAVRAQVQIGQARLDDAIADGIATGRPVIGMNADQLQQALGAPSKINTSNYGGRHEDQWIFYKPHGTWYVYTTNGIVRSTQFSEGGMPSIASSQQPCLSELEMHNLKVAANKLGASAVEQAAYRQALKDARDCQRQDP